MPDARRWTDAELEALEKRMAKEYRQASKEMRGKQEAWLAKFSKEREQREKALDGTQEAMDAHKRWLQSQAVRETWFSDMVDGLAESAHSANERAAGMVNDHLPRVYAENANRAAFAVDRAVRADTGFALVNEDAIRYLMGDMEQGQLVHEVTLNPEQQRLAAGLQSMRRDVDAAKDIHWNRQKFASAITQGILQGESIPNIVKRTESIYGMNLNAATRAARTATTSAENAGRMSSFERAERLGIDMEIEWLATLDGRTRSSHRALDGERIRTGEKFSNGLRWPGDPQGPGHELWNCRCRADGRVVGFDGKRGDWADETVERWSRLPEGMTYEDWKAAKPVTRADSYLEDWGRVTGDWHADSVVETFSAAYNNGFSGIVEGQDILGTWQRRPDQYDFEIEDVMAAQGFDGKPRIVDADEFDRAVKQANGGDGLIMQRVYSAPDQTKLDAYRESLYDGKWYVDCSHGNDTYGKGMYTASSKSTSVTQQMADEIAPYRREFSYTETMTLDPSARVIGYNEAVTAKNDASVLERAIIGSDDISDTERAIVRREVLREYSDEDRALARAAEREWDFDDYMDVIKKYSQKEREFRELGTSEVAALLGYDAVEVPGLNYTVVLNRTKLIIRRPE